MKYGYLIMVFCILLQGCTVYRKWTISLESAAKTKSRVKVVTVDGETWKFRKVLAREEGFYGISKAKGEQVEFRLDAGEIKAVYPRNNQLSSLLTRTLIAVPVTILLYDYLNNNLSWKQ